MLTKRQQSITEFFRFRNQGQADKGYDLMNELAKHNWSLILVQ